MQKTQLRYVIQIISLLYCLLILNGCQLAKQQSNNYITMSFDERISLAKSGDSVAQLNIGILYLLGIWPKELKSNNDEVEKWLLIAAYNDNNDAIIALCYLFDRLPTPIINSLITNANHDNINAIDTILQINPECVTPTLSKQGYNDINAIYNKWKEKRLTYYEQKAMQGDPDILTKLGFLYISGSDAELNIEKVVQLWQQAANSNNVIAMLAYARQLSDEKRIDYNKKIFYQIRKKVSANQATAEDLAILAVFYDGEFEVTKADNMKANVLRIFSLISTTNIQGIEQELGLEWRVKQLFKNWPSTEIEEAKMFEKIQQCQAKFTRQCY